VPVRGTASAAGTRPRPAQKSVKLARHSWTELSPHVSIADVYTNLQNSMNCCKTVLYYRFTVDKRVSCDFRGGQWCDFWEVNVRSLFVVKNVHIGRDLPELLTQVLCHAVQTMMQIKLCSYIGRLLGDPVLRPTVCHLEDTGLSAEKALDTRNSINVDADVLILFTAA